MSDNEWIDQANLKETGSTGLLQFSGYIFEDFLREWHGREAFKRANEMRLNSPVVGALLSAIEQSIRKVTWTFSSEEGPDDPRLEILESSRAHMTTAWGNHIIEALTMMPFGFALFEIVYQRWSDGSIIWKKFAPRGQDTVLRWLINDAGGIEGFVQQAAPHYRTVEIPIEKLLHYRTRSEKNNPEGRSILRQSWIPYYYAKNIAQIEAIGIERDLAGLPMIKLPMNASTETSDPNSDASKAAKMVRNIRQDEQAGIVLPFGWELALLTTGGSRQFDTNAIVARYESRIMMSALAQFLMLGQNGRGGSQALSQDQSHLFMEAMNTPADIIAEEITHQAIPRLMRLNGYEAEGLELKHSAAGDVDLSILAEALAKIQPFLSWTPEDEAWLRNVARLPTVSEEDILAEREKRDQAAQSALKMLQGGAGQPGGSRGGGQEPDGNKIQREEEELQQEAEQEMGATLFGSQGAGEEERLLWEGRYTRLLRSFLTGQKKRVLRGARGISR